MKKLCDLVTIEVNNEECVILKTKEDTRFDLIALGCFNGNEKMIRLTKGRDHTATVFTEKSHYSWSWGYSGYTLVSDALHKAGRLIQSCIEEDFGIYIKDNKAKIRSTLHITSLADKVGKGHVMRVMYWNESDSHVIIHKDGEFLTAAPNVQSARKYVRDRFAINTSKAYNAPTGCFVEEFEVMSK